MNGKHEITVSNRDISFKFTLERNITVVVGNSATGKTTLYELIYEHMRDGEHSGISLSCDKKCVVLDDQDWKIRLRRIKDSIVFIDEGADFISGKEFAREIRKTDNYYVIFNREKLKELPYSVEAVYEIKRSGKYCRFEKRYISDNQLVYNKHADFVPEFLVVEDAKSGFQFFQVVVQNKKTKCVSSKGNSNIIKWLEKHRTEKVLIIADGAALGSYANDVVTLIERTSGNIMLCLPESFEWMILASGILADKHISEVVTNPSEYIFSEEFFSWEKFFTDLLEKSTQGTYREYTKKEINNYYLSSGNA
ncbi:MAG: translation initiation factor 2, partial [Oscillospiraceae bacterium]|nr:translation initiation factor 2 [Oscillospiraceae bacterium]